MSEIAETLAHIDLTEMPTDITAGLPVGLYRARRGPWKASRAGHGSAAVSACSAAGMRRSTPRRERPDQTPAASRKSPLTVLRQSSPMVRSQVVCATQPFAGMGGVFLRRARRPKTEIVNDINGDIANLFRVVREHPDELARQFRWAVATRGDFQRLAACADSSDKIAASYVSPLIYQDYSCSQLGAELGRITARVAEVAGVQDEAASDDAALMGVGLVLFWPTLFFLDGDTGRESELGRLKGEIEAIEKAATRRNCAAILDDIGQRRAAAKAARKKKETAKRCADDASQC